VVRKKREKGSRRRQGRGAVRRIGVTTRPAVKMIETERGSTRIGRMSGTLIGIGMRKRREGRTCATSVEVRFFHISSWRMISFFPLLFALSSTHPRPHSQSSLAPGYGHIAVMCPSRQGAASSNDPPCYKCNGKGHRAFMCPNLAINRDICYRCGMPGHIARYIWPLCR